MATAATVQLRIVKNGGPITDNVYKAYYSDGTAASEDWAKGELLYLTGGFIKRIGTFNSAEAQDTDTTGWGAAYKRFIALEDHDSSAVGAADYVSVQEIRADTILEAQLAASGATSPTISAANVLSGNALGAYISATDIWGVNVDVATKGIFVIDAYGSDYNWPTTLTSTTGVNAVVHIKLASSLIL